MLRPSKQLQFFSHPSYTSIRTCQWRPCRLWWPARSSRRFARCRWHRPPRRFSLQLRCAQTAASPRPTGAGAPIATQLAAQGSTPIPARVSARSSQRRLFQRRLFCMPCWQWKKHCVGVRTRKFAFSSTILMSVCTQVICLGCKSEFECKCVNLVYKRMSNNEHKQQNSSPRTSVETNMFRSVSMANKHAMQTLFSKQRRHVVMTRASDDWSNNCTKKTKQTK